MRRLTLKPHCKQITENRFIAFLSDALFIRAGAELASARNTVAARIRRARSFASARPCRWVSGIWGRKRSLNASAGRGRRQVCKRVLGGDGDDRASEPRRYKTKAIRRAIS